MKSKFKIILLTMFFVCSFNVLAFAGDELMTLPSRPNGYNDYNYIVLVNVYKGQNYFCFFFKSPPVVNSEGRLVYPETFLQSTYREKQWGEVTTNFQPKYVMQFNDNYVAHYSNFDLKKSDGTIFFQKTQVRWWSTANLGGMLTQIRPIAIIVGGFLVLLIALRKGFSLLRTVLKGL